MKMALAAMKTKWLHYPTFNSIIVDIRRHLVLSSAPTTTTTTIGNGEKKHDAHQQQGTELLRILLKILIKLRITSNRAQ